MKGLDELERHGLLMLSDAARPALAQLVAGEPISGSWWGHLSAAAATWPLRSGEAVTAAVAKELDQRLLAHVWEVHTEKGSHEKRAEPWETWAAREGVVAIDGREVLERAVAAFGGGKLPWKRRR